MFQAITVCVNHVPQCQHALPSYDACVIGFSELKRKSVSHPLKFAFRHASWVLITAFYRPSTRMILEIYVYIYRERAKYPSFATRQCTGYTNAKCHLPLDKGHAKQMAIAHRSKCRAAQYFASVAVISSMGAISMDSDGSIT